MNELLAGWGGQGSLYECMQGPLLCGVSWQEGHGTASAPDQKSLPLSSHLSLASFCVRLITFYCDFLFLTRFTLREVGGGQDGWFLLVLFLQPYLCSSLLLHMTAD